MHRRDMRLRPSWWALSGLVWFCVLPAIAAEDVAQERLPTTDYFGDPLPNGACARLGSVRWRHTRPPMTVALSPNGDRFASVTQDGYLVWWDTRSGVKLGQIRLNRSVRRLKFDSSGQKLYLVGPQRLGLLDLRSGAYQMLGPVLTGNSEAFSPDGRYLISHTGPMQTIRVDLRTGQFQPLSRSRGTIGEQLLAVSPDSRWVIAWDALNNQTLVSLWDIHTGRLVGSRRSTNSPIGSVACSHDFRYLIWGGSQRTEVWAIVPQPRRRGPEPPHDEEITFELRPQAETVGRPEVANIPFLATLPDGRLLLVEVSGAGSKVEIWDLPQRRRLRSRAFPQRFLHRGDVNATGQYALLYGDTTTVPVLLDLHTPQWLLPTHGHRGEVTALAFAPDGRSLVSAEVHGPMRLWQLDSRRVPHRDGTVERRWQHHATEIPLNDLDSPNQLKFSAEGQWLFLLTGSGFVCRMRASDSQQRDVVQTNLGGIRTFAVRHDGQKVALVGDPESQGITLYDFPTRTEASLTDQQAYTFVDFARDGQHLIAITASQELEVWNLARGKPLSARQMQQWTDNSYRGRQRYQRTTAWQEESLMVWDLVRKRLYRSLEAYRWADLSPDGRYVVWGQNEQEGLHLRELATAAEHVLIPPRLAEVTSLAFAPDSQYLAVGYSSGEILLWDLRLSMPHVLGQLQAKADATVVSLLQSADLAEARQAMALLLQSGPEAKRWWLPLLQPKPPLPPAKLQRWLQALDSPRYREREHAEYQLGQWGDSIEEWLQSILFLTPSAEVKQRCRRLLDDMSQPLQRPEQRSRLRAVQLAEQIGDAECIAALRRLAEGETGLVARHAYDALLRRTHPAAIPAR